MRILQILHADDDPQWREMIGRLITRLGHSGTAVEGGQQVLDRLDDGGRYDLVILDNRMPPGISGVKTLELIRERPQFLDLPIFVVTGDEDVKGAVEKHRGVYIGKMRMSELLTAKLDELVNSLS